jgi:iron(III) transport system substrate-binding protein
MHPMPVRMLGSVVIAVVLVVALPAYAKTQLLVYTAVEAEELKGFSQAFTKAYPDIEIRWVRDSTGIITAKLLAEKANPRADVIWGLAATSLLLMKQENMLMPYAPPGLEKLDAKFKDADNPPFWVGQRAWAAVLCFNTIEAERRNLPKPASWQDLTKPIYKGHVAIPNPASSGTGYLDVSSWLQIFGEERGWAFMDALHQNISHYTHSGSKPCTQAAAGEVVIGISFDFRGAKLKEQGAPLELIVPSGGIGWDVEAAGIVKNTKQLEAAKRLIDWSVTEAANQLYNEGFAVVAIPDVAKPVKHYPEGMAKAMIDNDFPWAALHRQAILAEWQKRHDLKSEKK